MVIGSALTFVTMKYVEKKNIKPQKAVKKIIKANEKAMNWLKNKVDL